MIFRIFHLFSPPLDTFVIAGEISKSRVFFDTPCISTRERIPSPAIACCACGQVSREKWKNARAREIKASRSFARVNDRVCHDFNLLFFSLSLPLPPSFFPPFLFLYIYIYMYTDIMRSMCSMRYRVFSLFVQWLAYIVQYIVRSSGRKDLQREIEFLYGLLVASSGFTGWREIIAFDQTHKLCWTKSVWESCLSLSGAKSGRKSFSRGDNRAR